MKNRFIALGLTLTMAFTAFAPGVALAGEREAKNAAIGATVVSAYLLSQKKTRKAGYAGAVGSAYLWKKYGDQRKVRRKKEKARTEYYRRAAARNARTARYYRAKAHGKTRTVRR